MATKPKEQLLAITKVDDNLSILDMASSLLSQQKIVFGILADKNRPMTAGEIASEYYALLSSNIIMNWQLSNALNQIIIFYMQINALTAKTPIGTDITMVTSKPLDKLKLNVPNDFGSKLKFVRAASKWLLGKESKGVVLSAAAIQTILFSLPTQNASYLSSAKPRAYISPFLLKEWREGKQAMLDEINKNPMAKFDEELLRFYNLSNYLLSLRLTSVEKSAKAIRDFWAVQQVMSKATSASWAEQYAMPNDNELNTENFNFVIKEVNNFIEKLSIPKSILNTNLAIQYYTVPISEKLDGEVFAKHFDNQASNLLL